MYTCVLHIGENSPVTVKNWYTYLITLNQSVLFIADIGLLIIACSIYKVVNLSLMDRWRKDETELNGSLHVHRIIVIIRQ